MVKPSLAPNLSFEPAFNTATTTRPRSMIGKICLGWKNKETGGALVHISTVELVGRQTRENVDTVLVLVRVDMLPEDLQQNSPVVPVQDQELVAGSTFDFVAGVLNILSLIF